MPNSDTVLAAHARLSLKSMHRTANKTKIVNAVLKAEGNILWSFKCLTPQTLRMIHPSPEPELMALNAAGHRVGLYGDNKPGKSYLRCIVCDLDEDIAKGTSEMGTIGMDISSIVSGATRWRVYDFGAQVSWAPLVKVWSRSVDILCFVLHTDRPPRTEKHSPTHYHTFMELIGTPSECGAPRNTAIVVQMSPSHTHPTFRRPTEHTTAFLHKATQHGGMVKVVYMSLDAHKSALQWTLQRKEFTEALRDATTHFVSQCVLPPAPKPQLPRKSKCSIS
jgi:hypothetical protein